MLVCAFEWRCLYSCAMNSPQVVSYTRIGEIATGCLHGWIVGESANR